MTLARATSFGAAAPSDALSVGTRLRLFVMRPDTNVVAGGMVTN